MIGWRTLSHPINHLLVRFLILAIILFFTQSSEKNKFIRTLRLFAPILVLAHFYTETDYLNNIIFAHYFDSQISGLEYKILGIQWAEKFSVIFPANGFAEIMYFGYFSHYLLIISIPLFIYLKSGFDVTEKVIFITINSILIYYLIFIVFPVAGPQYALDGADLNLPKGYFFGWLIRTVQHFGEAPTGAFPSSHVGICLILVWLSAKNIPKSLWIIIPVSLMLIFSTVYIKAHYVVDVLAGFISMPIIYWISKKLYKKFNLKSIHYGNINS